MEIGADNHVLDTNGLVVGSARQPHSHAFLTSQVVKQSIKANRYRFVFLDGCSTAAGDWPAAFGIDKAEQSLDYYTSTNTNPKRLRPAVFVGWNVDIGGKNYPANVYESLNFHSYWMPNWTVDFPPVMLTEAIDQACDGANYLTLYQLHEKEYNHKPDWSP
jgi:hypothetical protein